MAVCFTGTQALNLRYRGQHATSKLDPARLSDGRYAVSENTLNDPQFALYRPLLKTGTIEATSGLTFSGEEMIVNIDSKPLRLEAVRRDYAVAYPTSGVFRFELRANDFAWAGDKGNNNRRCELVSVWNTYGAGETLWTAFSFVVGPDHAPFDSGAISGGHNLIHQWHSVDTTVARSPVFGIDLDAGNFIVGTRSDSGAGVKVVHYSQPRPTDGVVHNVVVSGLLGAAGHLNVWLDGVQIVNADTPIGYYNDDAGARDLAYPHWGVYQKNSDLPVVIYHANLEWGTTDLSARAASPLAVSSPPGGWV